jgi:integrase
VRKSATFPLKGAASAWAGRVESEIMSGVRGEIPNLTLADLLRKYEKEVSIGKKGARWEIIRLRAWERDRIAQVRLRVLDTPHVSDWQQRRLQAVSGASVRRERNLMNHVFELAVKEWKWLAKNPFHGVRRPKDSKPRDRVAYQAEISKLLLRASPAMKRVITWALETGMRASEIASLKDVKGRVAYIRDSKNNESREVPLSERAIKVWNGGFGLTAGSISSLFSEYVDELGLEGLTFHCLRRTAATHLAKRLTVWELCKMFGWKDPRIALNTYYKANTEEIAVKLA